MAAEQAPPYSAPSEPLPGYRASLEYFGVALMKTEFVTPYHYNSGSRGWRPVVMELCSTKLNVYELKVPKKMEELIVALYKEMNSVSDVVEAAQRDGVSMMMRDSLESDESEMVDAYGDEGNRMQFVDSTTEKLKKSWKRSKARSVINKQLSRYYDDLRDNRMLFEPISDRAVYEKFEHRGQLISSMTLSHSKVGEAKSLAHVMPGILRDRSSDSEWFDKDTLVKFDNVLRARIELKQILLQFWSFFGMVNWLRGLTIGKDLSTPVENRSLANIKTIPGRFSRPNNELLDAIIAESEYYQGNRRNNSNQHLKSDKQRSASLQSTLTEDFTLDTSSEHSSSGNSNSVFSSPSSSVHRYDVSGSSEVSHEDGSDSTVTIGNHKLVSYQGSYTLLEKRYISGCLPHLNSFDVWSGQQLTLSGYLDYLLPKEAESVSKKAGSQDIFISQGDLKSVAHKLEKRITSDDERTESRSCRNFLIHQHGLVSAIRDETA